MKYFLLVVSTRDIAWRNIPGYPYRSIFGPFSGRRTLVMNRSVQPSIRLRRFYLRLDSVPEGCCQIQAEDVSNHLERYANGHIGGRSG